MLSVSSRPLAVTPSGRLSYARIAEVRDGVSDDKFPIPNLIELQLESFKWFIDKGLRDLFEKGRTSRIGTRFHARIVELLDILDSVAEPKDLFGVRDFHALKGDRAGQYSMHVNGNWVLTFRFEGNDIADVDFEDYH